MRRALLYCTFNGIANCTNGIGRQAATLMTAWQNRRDELFALAGPFDLHVAIPTAGPHDWNFDPALLAYHSAVLDRTGGRLHELQYDVGTAFWSVPTWRRLSYEAAALAATLARSYDEVLVIAVDTPYAGVGAALGARSRAGGRVQTLLTPYGTCRLRQPEAPDPAWLEWDETGFAAAERGDVRLADIGRFFTRHLREAYEIGADRFVPWRSSLDLQAADLQPMPYADAVRVLDRFGVPADRPIIATIGRADPCKGVDRLIEAAAPIRDRTHLVAVITPATADDPLIAEYRRVIDHAGVRATLVPRFTRALPRALASLPVTVAVACPARGEVLANVPFEVALWAHGGGPIVVAPDHDGFSEQIDHDRSGLLYEPSAPGALTDALVHAIELSDDQRRAMCGAAAVRVQAERDVVPNLCRTLRVMWGPGGEVR